MTVHACTIIARNYLPYARVLGKSFRQHHPDGVFTALLIDDSDRSVDAVVEPFEIVHLDDILTDRRELHRLTTIYNVTELATAVKPLLLHELVARGAPHILYFDPDIWIFAALDDVAALAEQHGLVLTPHTTRPMQRDGRMPTEANILASGVYNLGFLGLGPRCDDFLDWWWERLRRDCVIDQQRMLFTDQKWVDFAPGYFRHHILRDPTLNVAYWNLDRLLLESTEAGYLIDGQPLRFFHFSGFNPELPYLLSKYQGDAPRVLLSERPEVADLCAQYAERLTKAGYRSGATADPDYGWDRLPGGMRLDTRARQLYRSALEAHESCEGDEPPDPFEEGTAAIFIDWLREPLNRGDHPQVSRYLMALWCERPDLQSAFPSAATADAEGFLHWVMNTGAAQESLPVELLPATPFTPPAAAPFRTSDLIEGANVAGYFKAEVGTGEGGRLLIAALDAAGIPTSTVVYRDTQSRQEHPFVEREGRDAPYDTNILCINADRVRRFAQEVGPSFFAGRTTVGMWAWELEDFPTHMHDGFDFVDEIWGVSTFVADAIRRVSPKPVFALPHPIAPPSVPNNVDRAALGLPEDRFMFLFLFDLFSVIERKNPFGLIKAFSEAFGPGEGPVLVIKTINGHHRMVELEHLRAVAADAPDVIVLDRYLSSSDTNALMAASDAYVSLHRAEGFGLTLAEAMALGKPVIGTGYSGNLDFMTEDNSYLVNHCMTEVPPGVDPYPRGSHWAEPQLAHAAALMRRVVEHPDEAAARGRRAAKDMARLHSPEARASFLVERLDALRRARHSVALLNEAAGPAPTARLSEAEDRLKVLPGTETSRSRFGRAGNLARRLVVRLMRAYWWGQRALDIAIVESLREEHDAREADQEILRSAVDLVRERLSAAEGRIAGGSSDRRQVAAAYEAGLDDLLARIDALEAHVQIEDRRGPSRR